MPSAARSGISTVGRVRCSATMWASVAQRGGQHHRHLVVLPRVQVDDVALREELGDAGLVDAEVGAAVLGRLGAGVAGDPDHLADLQLAVLGELAEEAHRAVLQVAERAVGGAGRPEAVERGHRVIGQVDGGDAHADAGVGELGDLLRQQRAAQVRVAVVPAPAGQLLRSPWRSRRCWSTRPGPREQAMNSGRSYSGAGGGVHPGAPRRQRGPVRAPSRRAASTSPPGRP